MLLLLFDYYFYNKLRPKMKRSAIKQHNFRVIKQVRELIGQKINTPYSDRPRMGYKELANRLNMIDLLSSRGNYWTMRSLYRMMQRQGVVLHVIESGLKK
jgi:hypothetical protein